MRLGADGCSVVRGGPSGMQGAGRARNAGRGGTYLFCRGCPCADARKFSGPLQSIVCKMLLRRLTSRRCNAKLHITHTPIRHNFTTSSQEPRANQR